MAEIPDIVERLIGPGMILGILPPRQDHATTLIIAGVSEIVWESIAYVIYIVLVLPQVEMAAEYSIILAKMLDLDFTVVRHLYHGIHLEMR